MPCGVDYMANWNDLNNYFYLVPNISKSTLCYIILFYLFNTHLCSFYHVTDTVLNTVFLESLQQPHEEGSIISQSYRWETDIQRALSNLHKVTLVYVVELGFELGQSGYGLAPECYAAFQLVDPNMFNEHMWCLAPWRMPGNKGHNP